MGLFMLFENAFVVTAELIACDLPWSVALSSVCRSFVHGVGSFSACSRVDLKTVPSGRFVFRSRFIASADCLELVEKLVTPPVLILYQNVTGICMISLMAS
jgi:hypothetical protein